MHRRQFAVLAAFVVPLIAVTVVLVVRAEDKHRPAATAQTTTTSSSPLTADFGALGSPQPIYGVNSATTTAHPTTPSTTAAAKGGTHSNAVTTTTAAVPLQTVVSWRLSGSCQATASYAVSCSIKVTPSDNLMSAGFIEAHFSGAPGEVCEAYNTLVHDSAVLTGTCSFHPTGEVLIVYSLGQGGTPLLASTHIPLS